MPALGATLPGRQGAQSAARLPDAAAKVPAAQPTHALKPKSVEYKPLAHSAHSGAWDSAENLPAAQAAHTLCPATLKRPALQLAQLPEAALAA